MKLKTGLDSANSARQLLSLRPFLQPLSMRESTALLLGADAAFVRALRGLRFRLTVADVDRLRVDALRARGVDAVKRDFYSAAQRLRPSSCTLVIVSGAGNALSTTVQRALVIAASRALAPGGLFVWSVGERDDDETALALPHVFARVDAGEGFHRACVVCGSVRGVETGAFFIVAQKDGSSDAWRLLDEPFSAGFGLSVFSLRRERRRDEALKRLEWRAYDAELTLQQAFQWREAYAVSAAAPPPRRRGLFAAIAKAFQRRVAGAASVTIREPYLEPDLSQEPFDVKLVYRRLDIAAKSVKALRRNAERPRLAYVSPLPPQRSGIADYSVQLLPALAEHYVIDVIVDDVHAVAPEIVGVQSIRDAAWFRANAGRYDRVLYHIGNSQFHAYMLPLLRDHPGVVVLHDFFLGHLLQSCGEKGGALWREELLASHGYAAARLQQKFPDDDCARDVYPANLFVIRQAVGVIAPNRYALALANRYYGASASNDWAVIPHMRHLPPAGARAAARRALGMNEGEFLVCCFGQLGESKQNDMVLEAWRQSTSRDDPDARLVFVGEVSESDFCRRLAAAIAAHDGRSRVEMEGFSDPARYGHYLAAADVAVQLRRKSRGESSYAVIDCMAQGTPVIVNAHGPMAELPADGVMLLSEFCVASDIAMALDRLKGDAALRRVIGRRARAIAETSFAPKSAARHFFDAIETFWASQAADGPRALSRAALELGAGATPGERLSRARQIVQKEAHRCVSPRNIFVDVTALSLQDAKTGIQRVTRAQLIALMDVAPMDVRVEPVRLMKEGGEWRMRVARQYADVLFDLRIGVASDSLVQPCAGDIYYCAELDPARIVDADASGFFQWLRAEGVGVAFCIYDLLPLTRPEFFPPGMSEWHAAWLRGVLANADALMCISEDVVFELKAWAWREMALRATTPIRAIHLGGDTEASAPTTGAPKELLAIEGALLARPTFLSVGTVEPRKGYFQTLRAFERLWARGVDVNLIVVGAEGWRTVEPHLRRNIPQLTKRLREHEENGARLFWLEDASDEWLDRLYSRATCLIAGSEAEGFGLPLVEAARRKLPILARDIPVFREVMGPHASYFSTPRADKLADAIEIWLKAYSCGRHVTTDEMPWICWTEHGKQLLALLLAGETRPAGEAS
jgi:glycosyltransferase involved in cell wall biosynthesis